MLKLLAIQVQKECKGYIMRCLKPDLMYYLCSDYEISQLLAEIMGAPAFEEVAGMTNKYSNELILDYGAYMIFLIDVADNQTDLV